MRAAPKRLPILLSLSIASLAGCTAEQAPSARSAALDPVLVFEDTFDGAFDPAWTLEGTTSVESSWGWGTATGESSFEIALSLATSRGVTVEANSRARGWDPADAFAIEWFDGSAWHELFTFYGRTRWVAQTWTLPEADGVEDFRLRFRATGTGRPQGQVDYVRISATPVECVHDAACDDGNACTNEACVDDACVYVNLPGAACGEGFCDGEATCWAEPMVYAAGGATAEHLDADGDGVFESFEARGGDLLTAEVLRADASDPGSIRRATLEFDLSSIPAGAQIVRAELDIDEESSLWLNGLDLDVAVYEGNGMADASDATAAATVADSLHMEVRVANEDIANVTAALQALMDARARWAGIRLQLTADESLAAAVDHRVTIHGFAYPQDWGKPRLRVFYVEPPLMCDPGTFVDVGGDGEPTCVPCAEGQYSDTSDAAGCTPWTTCVEGQYMWADGTAAADRECTGCLSGTFSVGPNAAVCDPWQDCPSGTHVSNAPSASEDRICVACDAGTYTAGPNESTCLPWGSCPAGTVQTAPGDATMSPACEACLAGTYCAGDTAAAVPCNDGDGTWDHDGDPATACTARTGCVPGEYVLDEGDATRDRVCEGCAYLWFSTETNAAACAPWTACVPGEYVGVPGTYVADQTCAACPEGEYSDASNAPGCSAWTACEEGYVEGLPGSATQDRTCISEWISQFGTEPDDYILGAAVDEAGTIFVGGSIGGTLPNQTSAGLSDAFVRKYTSEGEVLWTRQFGSYTTDSISAIAVDPAGDVVVAGRGLPLSNAPGLGSYDVFVRKYTGDGELGWTWEFGTEYSDSICALGIDAAGDVVVAGSTEGAMEGATSAGGVDIFLRKYRQDGTLLWTRQFGSATHEYCGGMTLDAAGDVVVVGYTWGELPGETSSGSHDAIVRKYDGDGTLMWTRQFGTEGNDSAGSVTVDAAGAIVVAGGTTGSLSGEPSAGASDLFVRKYTADGAVLWTRQLGSEGSDLMSDIAVGVGDVIFLAARTNGELPGATTSGSYDAVVLSYASDGTWLWTRQFGTEGADAAMTVHGDREGGVIVGGWVLGSLWDQPWAGGRDAFLTRLVAP